eukprot:62231-Prymnesium_polylepis.1
MSGKIHHVALKRDAHSSRTLTTPVTTALDRRTCTILNSYCTSRLVTPFLHTVPSNQATLPSISPLADAHEQ